MTSQSMWIVLSPKAVRSVTARSDRPISRWISWVLPPTFPREDSRALLSWVAAGIMAYSAVSQPLPVFFRKGGTPSSTDAEQITFVSPISMRTEPLGWRRYSRVMMTGRSSFAFLPSFRIGLCLLLKIVPDALGHGLRHGRLDRFLLELLAVVGVGCKPDLQDDGGDAEILKNQHGGVAQSPVHPGKHRIELPLEDLGESHAFVEMLRPDHVPDDSGGIALRGPLRAFLPLEARKIKLVSGRLL